MFDKSIPSSCYVDKCIHFFCRYLQCLCHSAKATGQLEGSKFRGKKSLCSSLLLFCILRTLACFVCILVRCLRCPNPKWIGLDECVTTGGVCNFMANVAEEHDLTTLVKFQHGTRSRNVGCGNWTCHCCWGTKSIRSVHFRWDRVAIQPLRHLKIKGTANSIDTPCESWTKLMAEDGTKLKIPSA